MSKQAPGVVASLAVALIVMFLNNAQAAKTVDEADKREMRARLSLLTTQLQNVQPAGPSLSLRQERRPSWPLRPNQRRLTRKT